jgi:two-component system LytT family sensor kinase
MASFTLRQYISPLIHLLLWVLFAVMLLLFQPLSWQVNLPNEFWLRQGLLLSLLVLVFYLNHHIWVPRLLFENRIGWFVALIILAPVLVVIVVQQVENWLNLPELMHRAFHPSGTLKGFRGRRSHFDIFLVLTTLLVLGISTSVKSVQKWQKDMQLRERLEQQRISSELSFLKAQINPHFFFNTLNNIYALTLTDTDLARKALHKLSRMMRYVLYETQKDTTLLSQEMAFLQDYMELMQLRLTDKVEVRFESPSPVKDVLIAPMLLLPFVENAFKHGVSALEPSCIYIGISQEERNLQMEVRNRVFADSPLVLEESSGIGLNNTRRRLDLLYPDRYKLEVREKTEKNEYQVNLNISLI